MRPATTLDATAERLGAPLEFGERSGDAPIGDRHARDGAKRGQGSGTVHVVARHRRA